MILENVNNNVGELIVGYRPYQAAKICLVWDSQIAQLEEEVHDMHEALQGQREVLDSMARDFSKFSIWTVTSLARLMDRDGVPYTRYSESPVEYQRCTRQSTDEPSTSTVPQQPYP
ncbi:hypothetical protein Tco_0606758 [Tanacetum coccineum]